LFFQLISEELSSGEFKMITKFVEESFCAFQFSGKEVSREKIAQPPFTGVEHQPSMGWAIGFWYALLKDCWYQKGRLIHKYQSFF